MPSVLHFQLRKATLQEALSVGPSVHPWCVCQSVPSTVSETSTWNALQTGPLEAENVDTTSIKLAWNPPIVNGRDKVTKKQEELVQGGADELDFNVKNLFEGKEYKFQIDAEVGCFCGGCCCCCRCCFFFLFLFWLFFVVVVVVVVFAVVVVVVVVVERCANASRNMIEPV